VKQATAAPIPRLATGTTPRGFRVPRLGLFTMLLAIAVLPLLSTNLALSANTRTRLLDLAVANLRERSVTTASSIDAYLQARRKDIVVVSQLPDVIAYLQNQTDEDQRDAARSELLAAAAASPAYESIAALSLDGLIVAASTRPDEGTNVRFRDYFQNARAGQIFISDPSYSVITNRPALFFSAPVRTVSGLLVGVVRSRLNLGQIWDLIESDGGSVGQGATSFLVDDYGIRLGVSDTRNHRDQAEALIYKPIAPIEIDTAKRLAADKRFGQKTADQLVVDPLPELKTVADVLPAGGVGAFSYQSRGADERAVATRLVTKAWIYVVSLPTSTYATVVGDSALDLLAGIALVIALALAGAVFLPRMLSAPVLRMARLAEQVSSGNISPDDASFGALAEDDVSKQVATAFDRLTARLSQAVRLISGSE
jgi:C4-dicarboxylate-specific signal transduction histidine kinase